MTQRIGIYPGTFDPITLGHADIIRRGSKLVDKLIIGVTTNPSKNPMFSTEERFRMVEREIANLGLDNVVVEGFNALLVKFAQKMGGSVLIRGLRAVADFEYEYQMAGMNQQLDDDIETVFLMADVSLQPIASKLVKEIALFGGDITPFVSKDVCEDVIARVEEKGRLGDY
ncbi:pantetheine-phosphate adenylyltransferase [Qipengyuania vesicularis]|uniref:pantetheine-phosphate adenylyltransferase n=1 Tax=Qipengyuania vesicularis TaxID=2867232 RepID=UPI001C873446|nr:pantetheine-phosphate adenylyltransferase [Qipengyuania vesicularis]MBX7527078.1 pantetheine-phosphate adenylyltransferase [Qipengyuania vesicularis]